MTPEKLIMKYREEFFNIFEYDPPETELMDNIKYEAQRYENRIIYYASEIKNIIRNAEYKYVIHSKNLPQRRTLEDDITRLTSCIVEFTKSYETHLKALEILRSEKK